MAGIAAALAAVASPPPPCTGTAVPVTPSVSFKNYNVSAAKAVQKIIQRHTSKEKKEKE